MIRRFIRLAVVFSIVGALVVPGGSASTAVACGDVLTSDTAISTDLFCPGGGLVVGADGITLDFKGHTISGAGTGAGVDILAANVTVKNGSVAGFGVGVDVDVLGHGGGTSIEHLTVTKNGFGISTLDRNGGTIENSVVSHNAGGGINIGISRNWAVDHNTVVGNAGRGIRVGQQSDGAVITNNFVAQNIDIGIAVVDSTGTYSGNTMRGNGSAGMLLVEEADPALAPAYLIANNVANDNAGVGISACVDIIDSPCAPGMHDGGGNAAKHNAGGPQCINIVCSLKARAFVGASWKAVDARRVDTAAVFG